METDDLTKLEACCEAFYGNYEAQRAAHDVLLPLVSDPNCLPQLQMILARSQNPHSLIFAASGLLKLISTGWNRITDSQKDDTRKFVLNYLYNHGPQLLRSSSILLQNLVRLLCRIVKLGWLESLQNQNITEQVRQFLQSSTPHWVVGLTIYTILTEDMQPIAGSQLARFRRTAMSFRETALSEIFEIAIQTLQQLNAGTMHFTDGTDERLLLRQVLQLTLNCLNFDFMGTVADDAGEDQTTVMIPHTWAILRQEKIPQLFFEIYSRSWTMAGQPRPDCGRLCLQCLVLIAAIRKSFFQKDEDRALHVSQLIEGTSSIVQSGLGLQDDQCYHELCRLLGKINAANHLWEMSQTSGFQIWLENVLQFTMRSLDDWKHLPNSKHYLVGLWSNMVAPLLYLKERAPIEVFRCIKKITIAFIDSRMKIAEAVAQAQIEDLDIDYEDPLSNEVMRAEQLEVVHNLSRCSYSETCTHVMNLFNEVQTQARDGRVTPQEFQQKATWLVYMMGSLINVTWMARGPRIVALNGDGLVEGRMDEDTDQEDSGHRIVGDMASLVFGLIAETDKLDTAPEGLELGYLAFLEQFREVYIGDRAKQTMQMHVSESLFSTVQGASSTTDVLNLMVEKLFRNLQRRAHNETVVQRTLHVLNHSVTGVSVVHATERLPYFVVSGRLLLQSELVKETIMDHQNPKFTFLSIPKYGKFRSTYYSTLTKLLLMEMKDDTSKFDQFMIPFGELFNRLETAVSQNNLDTSINREIIIHLARDLRGVIFAATSPESYNLLFSWLVNRPKQPGASKIDIFTRAVDIWWSDHQLMIPVLKFMVEMVHNKSQRISFDANSPNGIFLFKVVSTLLLAYGQRILARSDFPDLYRQKYKGIACALDMFTNTLSGGYTNFGVFEVYNDNVLANSLQLGLQLCLAIPDEDLQAYIKSLKSFYHFLEIIAQHFMEHVILLPSESLAQLLRCLEDGLCSFEGGVNMQCCSTIDSIVHHIFIHKDKNDDMGESVRRFLVAQPNSLRRILQLMFQLVITGEMSGTWSMSRPLLGLILLHQDDFMTIQEQIMLQQIPERRLKLKGNFDDLMTGVEANLSVKNRDIFTKNLYTFAQAMRASFA